MARLAAFAAKGIGDPYHPCASWKTPQTDSVTSRCVLEGGQRGEDRGRSPIVNMEDWTLIADGGRGLEGKV